MEADHALTYIFCHKRLMLSNQVIILGGFAASFHPIIKLYGNTIYIPWISLHKLKYTKYFGDIPCKLCQLRW